MNRIFGSFVVASTHGENGRTPDVSVLSLHSPVRRKEVIESKQVPESSLFR
jgi:hypothetical protein